MPAIVRFDQQSVCAARRFRDYGKPNVPGSGGNFSRRAGAMLERSDEDAGGARHAAGTGSGSARSNTGGKSRQAQLAQATLAEFLRRGLFSKHLAKMRKVYTSRLTALDEALRKHMPEGTRWTRPEGGMCLWLELPLGFDASELLIHVKERGVLFAPGRYFYVQAPLPNTLRLGFASLDEKQIARGVATLAELLKIEMRKRQRGVRRAERSRVALV